MMLRLVSVLVAVVSFGCAQRLRVHHPISPSLTEMINSTAGGGTVVVLSKPAPHEWAAEGALVRIDDKVVQLAQTPAMRPLTLPLNEVAEIETRRHGLGARDGLIIGMLVGALAGFTLGYLGSDPSSCNPDTPCLDIRPEHIGVFWGVIGLPIGAAVGTVIGAAKGRRYVFEF